MLTPQERKIRAKLAANTRWSRQDPKQANSKSGLRAKFDREVREETPGLSEAEYDRRAACKMQAQMNRLALASFKIRRARRALEDVEKEIAELAPEQAS
jgi:hypothetical protein